MDELILVVDDSPEICNFIADHILKPKGYRVLKAEDGQRGLQLALAHKPHLIITDVMMPNLTGLEMLQAISDHGITIPSVLITAHGSEEVAVNALRLGVREYAKKPFNVEEMMAMLDRVLREGRLARERDILTQQLVVNETKLRRTIREMNILHEISKSLSASLDLQQVLDRITEAAISVTAAESSHLLLKDRDELYVESAQNLDIDSEQLRLPIGSSLAGKVFETKKLLLLNPNDTTPGKIKTDYLVRSLVYVPLVWQGESIGVLGVMNRQRPATFTKENVRTLNALATYSAMAIHNANAFTASNNQRMQLHETFYQGEQPTLIIDDDFNILMVNAPAREVLQIAEADPKGLNATTAIQDQMMCEFVCQPFLDSMSIQAEFEAGNNLVYMVHVTPIKGVGRSVTMYDVTEARNLVQLKNEFIASVSHDLRSPLTSIRGYVELLASAGNLTNTQELYAKRVVESVDHISEMVTQLLDIGRLESGLISQRPCQIDNIVRRVIHKFKDEIEEKDIQFVFQMSKHIPPMFGDPYRLQQAFSELLDNAVRYTSPHARIGVRIREVKGQAIINVSDTGMGISVADQKHIYDKFFRSTIAQDNHPDGMGLGLALVRSVIEQHGGRIWVNSERNKGTTFTIVLPTTPVTTN